MAGRAKTGLLTIVLVTIFCHFTPGHAAGQTSGAFVPLDSWIYPALDRLAALGFVPSQTAGIRPWSRRECLRQVAEAQAILDNREDLAAATAVDIVDSLHRELAAEDGILSVESVYLRSGVIAGTPLNDSFHFGQTVRDDFGRPFGRGLNSYAGTSLRAAYGHFFAGARAELQQAGGRPAYSPEVRSSLARFDLLPPTVFGEQPSVRRARVIEGYVGAAFGPISISVGKQSLYWGPGSQAPLSFSSNAEPTQNAKLTTDAIRLPGPLRRLGTVKAEFVFGKLGGHSYTWRPWFNGQKISLKINRDLEVGFTRWSILFGAGHPMTLGALFRNLTSTASDNSNPNDRLDRGDRKGGFDFRLRVPGVRDWLTVYSDSYSDDDPSPLAAPRRAAVSPGLWLTRVPWLPALDFKIEAAATKPFFSPDHGGQFLYWNNQYRSGNTNYGFLLGNPTGRDGRSVEFKSAYWLSPRERIEGRYRQQKIASGFLPGGGTQSSGTLAFAVHYGQGWHITSAIQYERYWIPLLGGPRRNLSAWLQLSWEPYRDQLE